MREALAPQRAELVPLTTMRGIAAAFVVVYHLHYRESQAWSAQGYLWVDFFFILSGFIMAYVYGEEFASGATMSSYRAFIVKRLARIYPLHMAMFAVTLALAFGLHVHHFRSSLHSIVTNAALVHAWGLEHQLTWNVVSWSISAEWAFYLVFPLLVPLLLRANIPRSLAGIALALLGLCYLEHVGGSLNLAYDYAVPRCLLEATIGILLHNLYRSPSGAWLHRVARLDAVRWPMFLVPFALMQYSYDTAVVASFTIVLLSVALADGSFQRFLTWQPLKHVGDVSYSLYMSHWIVLYFVLKVLSRIGLDSKNVQLPLYKVIAGNGATVLLCVGIASVLYRWIEVPGRSFVQITLARRSRR